MSRLDLRLPAILGLLAICSACAAQTDEQSADTRPNILLIVADDLGYADLGVHGSEIRTPNIDSLAASGVRFSSFHTAPLCAPTRAMLLTGNNNNVAGMGSQVAKPMARAAVAGYEGYLPERVVPFPRLLRDAGYHTYMAGKWHLGYEESQSPVQAGFERSFALMEGGANHFDGRGFENHPSRYREDGMTASWPDGEYSTEYYTNRIIDYLEESRGDGKPFFVYAAYTSPHWPLQVPDDELDRYAGVFDDGYDALREKNFAALQQSGMVQSHAELPPRNPAVRPWEELSDEERRREARKMELYAAMVENLDDHVGRLVGYLRETGQYDNTLIVFMGDNGADGMDLSRVGPFVDYISEHYSSDFDQMGRADGWAAYDRQWAEAGSAPFRLYKTFTTEGGVVAPMLVTGPGVSGEDEISHTYLTVMDLAPTFLELAGASYPTSDSIRPMLGESLMPLLSGDAGEAHGEDYVTVLYHDTRVLVRRGRWKLTANNMPFSEAEFRLYDIEADPGETTDLSESHVQKRDELLAIWRTKRVELGIVIPEDLFSPMQR